jgi:hypothetical protein
MTVMLLCLTKEQYRTHTDVQNVNVRIVIRISVYIRRVSIIAYVNLALDGTFMIYLIYLPLTS